MRETIEIPPVAYEINEINEVIQGILVSIMAIIEENIGIRFSLSANNNTLKCEISSTIDMSDEKSIASLLKFEHKVCKGDKIHRSTLLLNSKSVRIIRLDCNIT